jgi:hypothetical protein
VTIKFRLTRLRHFRKIRLLCICLVKNRMSLLRNACAIFVVRIRNVIMPYIYAKSTKTGSFTILNSLFSVLLKQFHSKGCRYLFMRGGESNRLATLKRVPTKEEFKRFNISGYPHSMEELRNSSTWMAIQSKILQRTNNTSIQRRPTFQNMTKSLGKTGKSILKKLFRVRRHPSPLF